MRAKASTAAPTTMASPIVEHIRLARSASEASVPAPVQRPGRAEGLSSRSKASKPKSTEPTKPIWKPQVRSSAPAPRNPSRATAAVATQGPRPHAGTAARSGA